MTHPFRPVFVEVEIPSKPVSLPVDQPAAMMAVSGIRYSRICDLLEKVFKCWQAYICHDQDGLNLESEDRRIVFVSRNVIERSQSASDLVGQIRAMIDDPSDSNP